MLIRQSDLFVSLRVIGVALGVIVISGSFLVRRNSTPQLQPSASDTTFSGAYDLTTGQMLHRPTFWLYLLWNLCMAATGMLVINNASSISVFYGAAAVIGLLVSVFNSGIRFVIGFCMDKLGWKVTMFLDNAVIIGAGLLMTIGGRMDSFALILIGMLLAGGCYGGGITIQAALIRGFYGSTHYASNLATCNLVAIPAAILGPMLSAALVDAAGGTYGTTFLMVMVMGLVSLGINFLIRKP